MSTDARAAKMHVGTCVKCGIPKLVGPLHGEQGGPDYCVTCGIDWYAVHGRQRKLRRNAIRAMRAYAESVSVGGLIGLVNFDRLKFAAWGSPMYKDDEIATTEPGELTLELLEDAIRLTHPDRHPTERQEQANRVTQALLALKPYVFPAKKPEPPKPAQGSNGSIVPPRRETNEPLRQQYPCELCADARESNYCATCKAKAEEIRARRIERFRKQKERSLERRRQRYRQSKQYQRYLDYRQNGKPECGACGEEFDPKRKDAKYCSAACRQRAHRETRVTDKSLDIGATTQSRNRVAA